MTTPATSERHRFADELAAVGPDADTLCGEWTTRDLAAHIIVRERRPDAAGGILIPAFAGYTAKVQDHIAQRPYDSLVDEVRSGPPIWNPARIGAVDVFINTAEFFVHLEDVRRAAPEWTQRELEPDLVDDLYGVLGRLSKQLTRTSPVGITLNAPEREPIVAHRGEPMVQVTGPVGELVLWVYGRKPQAEVTFDGDEDAIKQAVDARFSL